MVKFGAYGRDNVTGFEGLVTVRAEHLHGCVHVGLEPTSLDQNGKPKATEFFDEQRITVLSEDKVGSGIERQAKMTLGNLVHDPISGLEGIVVVINSSLFGRTEIAVQRKGLDKDNEPYRAKWFDEDRLELVSATEPVVSPHSSARTGSITIAMRALR